MLKKSEQQSTGQLALLFPEGGPQPALWDLWDRAGAKVGLTSVARLRWLIEFAERHDASEFPEDLALEALCFLVQQGLFIELAKASRFSGKVFWELSKAVSDGLDHLLAGTEWKIVASDKLHRSLYRRKWTRRMRTGRNENVYELGNSYDMPSARPEVIFATIFQLVAMDLLYASEPWRLARCARPECSNRFIRRDPRQDFCSANCSQSVRSKRWMSKGLTKSKKAAPSKRPPLNT